MERIYLKELNANFSAYDGKEVTVEGRTYGNILHEETGEGGFGYDSLFLSDDLNKSFGLATAEEKNGVSHRFRALQALREKIEELGI